MSHFQIKNNHFELRGHERLMNVVECLSKECPWTQSIQVVVIYDILNIYLSVYVYVYIDVCMYLHLIIF